MGVREMEKVKHSGVRKLVEGYDYHRIDPEENEGRKYILVRPVVYWTRYGRSVTAWSGYRWDGATGAKDLNGSILRKYLVLFKVPVLNSIFLLIKSCKSLVTVEAEDWAIAW